MQSEWRDQFEARSQHAPSVAEVESAAQRAKTSGDADARLSLAAAFYHAAFAAPERIAQTYDAAACGWFGAVMDASPIAVAAFPVAHPPASLWADFWSLVDTMGTGTASALDITNRTAALAQHLPPEFQARSGAACAAYPGVIDAVAGAMPPRFVLEDLRRCPPGSLGHDFYRQVVDNGFDLEVLDRDALGLAGLPAPHNYLNTRILQTHDLIHLTAGYDVSPLHEVAISAFQLAQFGHAYSSMFLALVAAAAAQSPIPGAFNFMLELILSAWAHGRRAPQLLSVPWEEVWHEPVDAVRKRFGVIAFRDPLRAVVG